MAKTKKRAKKARKIKKPKIVKFSSVVTRLLDRQGVQYKVLPHKKTVWSAADIAKERKRPLSAIVKCIVLSDGKRSVMACVPGNKKVKAGLVKNTVGTKKLEFVSEKDLKKITGQLLGTTAPLALKTEIPIVIDKSLAERKKVSISSGNKKFGLELATKDLLRLTNATVAEIAE